MSRSDQTYLHAQSVASTSFAPVPQLLLGFRKLRRQSPVFVLENFSLRRLLLSARVDLAVHLAEGRVQSGLTVPPLLSLLRKHANGRSSVGKCGGVVVAKGSKLLELEEG